MGSLSRGWSMARASFAVVRRYPKIAILPVISGAAWLLVLGLLVLSLLPLSGLLYGLTAPLWDKLGSDRAGHIAFYVAAAVVLYALTVVTVFFNVALISCALRCHAGQEPSIRAGLAAAKSCLPQILGWALVAATVGLALNAVEGLLQDKLGIVGDLIGGLFGFAWSLATYFVLPVLVVEKVGPITAIRRSSAILRSKWGESLAGETRFGLLGFLFVLQAAAVFFAGLAIQLSYGSAAMAGLGVLLMALGALYGLVIVVIFQVLSTIFLTGVYVYAVTDRIPSTLDAALVAGSFRSKK
ncbi:MAG TPA: DUF6159 family protein [Steroidobacteraceae bacterium]